VRGKPTYRALEFSIIDMYPTRDSILRIDWFKYGFGIPRFRREFLKKHNIARQIEDAFKCLWNIAESKEMQDDGLYMDPEGKGLRNIGEADLSRRFYDPPSGLFEPYEDWADAMEVRPFSPGKVYVIPTPIPTRRVGKMTAISSIVEELLKTKCSVCVKQTTLVCNRCKTARYCSRECQRKHWSAHKPTCAINNGK